MFTVRLWMPNRRGRTVNRLSNPNIKFNSVVHISVSEATALSPIPSFTAQNFSAFLGAASITLQNVVVNDGQVEFVVFVDWPDPLNIVADITIMDGPPNLLIGT